jgi:hypothetical protein
MCPKCSEPSDSPGRQAGLTRKSAALAEQALEQLAEQG